MISPASYLFILPFAGPGDSGKPEPPSNNPLDDDSALFSYEGFPDPRHLENAEDRKPVPPMETPEIPEDPSILPDPNIQQNREPESTLKIQSPPPPSPLPDDDVIHVPAEKFAAPEISSDEIYRVESPKKLFGLDYLLACLLGFIGFLAVVLTYDGIGLSWDESYYIRPGLRTLQWFQSIASSEENALSGLQIDQFFSGKEDIPELPMVPKIIFAAGFWLNRFFEFDRPYIAMRIPVAICFGLTLTILYLLAGKFYARTGAILTVICYMTIPRVFGHAHIAATETILVFFTVLFTYCFVKGLDSWKWALAAGVAYGFCLATKFNAIFIPVTLLLWAHIFQRRHYANNVFCILFVAPVVMFAIWPWLWPDPTGRLIEYLTFFVQHKFIPVVYYGTRYPMYTPDGVINVSWTYPFILTAFTTPTIVLLLAVVGLARTIRNLRSHDIGVLFLLGVLVPLGIAALPFSPKYDGVRLFLPAFPFVALLAGIGGEGLAAAIRGFRTNNKRYAAARYFAEVLVIAILGYGLIVISRVHPHELSYWNLMFNGLKGAHNAGMQTTHWGEAVNEEVYSYLNQQPEGTHVRPLALHDLTFRYLQEWKIISPQLKISTDGPGDVILLQMREGFFGPEERTLANLYEQGYAGQALVSYEGIPFILAFDLRQTPWVRKWLPNVEPPSTSPASAPEGGIRQ